MGCPMVKRTLSSVISSVQMVRLCDRENYFHFLYENTCAELNHPLSLQSLWKKIEVMIL